MVVFNNEDFVSDTPSCALKSYPSSSVLNVYAPNKQGDCGRVYSRATVGSYLPNANLALHMGTFPSFSHISLACGLTNADLSALGLRSVSPKNLVAPSGVPRKSFSTPETISGRF